VKRENQPSGCVLGRVDIPRGDLADPVAVGCNRIIRRRIPVVEKSIGTTGLANSDSIAAASTGRDSRKPCADASQIKECPGRGGSLDALRDDLKSKSVR